MHLCKLLCKNYLIFLCCYVLCKLVRSFPFYIYWCKLEINLAFDLLMLSEVILCCCDVNICVYLWNSLTVPARQSVSGVRWLVDMASGS